MKKILKLVMVLTLSILLVSCGTANKKAEEVTYKAENNGVISTITFYYKGDKVEKQTAHNELSYAAVGISDKDQAEELYKDLMAQYEGIEGLTHSVDYQDDKLIEDLEMDYEKLNVDDVKGIQGINLDENAENGVSLEKSTKLLEDQGYTKQ